MGILEGDFKQGSEAWVRADLTGEIQTDYLRGQHNPLGMWPFLPV